MDAYLKGIAAKMTPTPSAPTQETAPPKKKSGTKTQVGDMTARRQRKRQTVVNLPSGAGRHPGRQEKKVPSAAEHMDTMRAARGLTPRK